MNKSSEPFRSCAWREKEKREREERKKERKKEKEEKKNSRCWIFFCQNVFEMKKKLCEK